MSTLTVFAALLAGLCLASPCWRRVEKAQGAIVALFFDHERAARFQPGLLLAEWKRRCFGPSLEGWAMWVGLGAMAWAWWLGLALLATGLALVIPTLAALIEWHRQERILVTLRRMSPAAPFVLHRRQQQMTLVRKANLLN